MSLGDLVIAPWHESMTEWRYWLKFSLFELYRRAYTKIVDVKGKQYPWKLKLRQKGFPKIHPVPDWLSNICSKCVPKKLVIISKS